MPEPTTEEHLKRVDCEFERAGTPVALVSFHGGLRPGWRRATSGQRRTTTDWAHEVGSFLEGLHSGSAWVALMLDTPTTHRPTVMLRSPRPKDLIWRTTRWRGSALGPFVRGP